MFHKDIQFDPITWRSYQIVKKKAMEQELSWSGLAVSLSIAFFIVITCAGLLNLAYHSLNKDYQVVDQAPAKHLIRIGVLASLKIKSASAASLDLKASPSKDTEYITLTSGQNITKTIKLKNTGKDIWRASEINLETGPYLKTFSRLETSAWLKFYRLVKLPKDVKPGQTIEITFSLKAPTDIVGTFQENFQLVRQERPITGSLVRFFVTINEPKSVINQPISSNQNQVKSDTVVATPLAPIIEPSNKPYLNNNSSQEAPSGVINKNLLPSEPIIRVGLFNSSAAQRLSSNSLFDVYAGQEIIFSGLPAGSIVLANYDQSNQRYTVTYKDWFKTSLWPLRFISRDQRGIFTLLDYKNNPAWNSSLQDNSFRGIIEMRYTLPAKKVWLINELPLENYLRGLAETTNASSVEFQKVMVTAARSYALYHYLRGVEYGLIDASTKHAADHFHIDAYYDQVYRGYNSEIRMPRLSSAVDLTRGVAVTYNNKPVVTPYFSNSDGRTRSYTEVWGGTNMPWLVSVAVPQDSGKNLFGHGVGLSARGALLMINEGKSWLEVLKYFYTKTTLFKVY